MKQEKEVARRVEILEQGNPPSFYIEKFQAMSSEAKVFFRYDEEEDDLYMTTISYRLETDEEEEFRENLELSWNKHLKVRRYENYLKLKEEFENEVPETDPLDVDIKGDLD